MSPRQARRERREAERKAKKLELKKSRLAENQPRPAPPFSGLNVPDGSTPSHSAATVRESECEYALHTQSSNLEIGFVSQRRIETNRANANRAAVNRANALLSTGPTSPNGKLASSRNSTKHGLASGTILIPGEDPAAFETFLTGLFEEHQPATPTEELLVKEMAQSHWLAQRALRLQNTCFTDEGVNEKLLALFLRYQTTHQRAFYKALNQLTNLKKCGFVSQHPSQPAHASGFASQRAPEPALQTGFVSPTDAPPPIDSEREARNQAHAA